MSIDPERIKINLQDNKEARIAFAVGCEIAHTIEHKFRTIYFLAGMFLATIINIVAFYLN